MSLLFRWQGGTLGSGIAAPPGLTGYGDVGSATGGNNGIAAFLDTTTHQMANRTVVALRATHALFVPDPQWRIPPNVHPSQGPALVTGPFSARLYWRRAANHATLMPIILFREGNTPKLFVASDQNNGFVLAGLTGPASAATPHTAMWRIELQVDPQRNPSVVMRVYLEDNTTPVVNRTANPADVAWDNFLIGLFNGYHPVQAYWADIEVHDDYDLGGQFTSNPPAPEAASTTAVGAPASNPQVEPRFHYDEGTRRTVVTKGEPSYTSHLDVIYVDDPSHAGRALDLYVPTGTPPEGGWPVILWAHGGFWTAGSRKDLPSNWRDDLLAAGWAVATVTYCRSTLTVFAYPEYGSGGDGGRWPSFPLDFKRAAAFLRDNAATWGINPQRMVASGFSAGAHIALAAACSAGLTADAAGNPMTLAGATVAGHRWADGYTGTDPEFAGVLVTAGPVDVDLATAWDPTHSSAGSIMHAAIRAFRGLSQTGDTAPSVPEANVADLIARNAGNVPPIAFVGSLSDYLVHWEHEQALAAACATHGVDYTLLATPNAHDPAQHIYDIDQQLTWLNALNALDPPGGEDPPVAENLRVLWVENGVELVECALSTFDGATEVPLTLEVAGGEDPPGEDDPPGGEEPPGGGEEPQPGAQTRQWSTPPYRPNRAEVWPESFIYMRVDGLPKHPDSDEAIEQLIHFHTIEYDGGHTPTPYLRFRPFGTSAWNAGGSAGYFVDVMPPEIEGAELDTYMRTWRHQSFSSTASINAQTGELDRHYWHPSMRQQDASKSTTEWLHTDFLGLPYMIGNYGDRHSIMYVPQARALVECIGFMGTYNPLFPGSPTAESVVTWDLDSYILPLGYTNEHPAGVTATRVPTAPFFFTYDDLMDAAQNPDGDLGHALIFEVANYNNKDGKGNTFYWPFRATDGTGHDGPLLGGSWMRLRSDYPVDALPTEWLKALARTLQRYGCLLFDKNFRHAMITTCVDPKWPTTGSPDFFTDRDLFHLSDFELVDVSSVAPENPNDMRPLSLDTPDGVDPPA